ncbi:MAG: heme exporter protein CcmD [Gammaproteobacteria bacterium]|nr:MAG: heme exporter protein CcmD [Gammaproteobacteria bacterium]
MNLREFFSMGGYAFYVWTSYALALFVLIANVWMPVRCQRQALKTIARKMRRARRTS